MKGPAGSERSGELTKVLEKRARFGLVALWALAIHEALGAREPFFEEASDFPQCRGIQTD